jgi:HlyD family secretion protein
MAEDQFHEEGKRTELEELIAEPPRPRWRRWMKILLPALVLLVLALSVSYLSSSDEQPSYISEEVERGKLEITVAAVGSLYPINQVAIGTEISGRIDRVLVQAGDSVIAGQVLAIVNTDIINDEISQALASLNAAKAQADQAQATLEVDTSQLRRLEAVFEESGGRVPSQFELDQARANVKRANAGLTAAMADVQVQRARLSTAKTNRNRAVIRSPVSGVVLSRQVDPGQTVVASFNTPTLFIVADDLSLMQLRVNIDEADIGRMQPGQKAKFSVDAYPAREFYATVERVAQASNSLAAESPGQSSGASSSGIAVVTYEAQLTVVDKEGLLRPGMTASALISSRASSIGLLVPNGALRFRPGAKVKTVEAGVFSPNIGLGRKEQQAQMGRGVKRRVYVLQNNGNLHPVEVKVVDSDGRSTLVRSNELQAGMRVVTGLRS